MPDEKKVEKTEDAPKTEKSKVEKPTDVIGEEDGRKIIRGPLSPEVQKELKVEPYGLHYREVDPEAEPA